MIIGPRRAVLIGAIAAVALAIIFYPLIVFTPIDVEKVGIDLTSVGIESGGAGDQAVTLEVVFTVKNTNNITLTTSNIDYELFADGTSIGTNILSYEDIPVTGRPQLFPGTSVALPDKTFTFKYSDPQADLFNKILSNSTQIDWRVTGTAVIDSATTQVTKEFSDEL